MFSASSADASETPLRAPPGAAGQGLSLAREIGRPIVHQATPPLEQVRAPVGCLDLFWTTCASAASTTSWGWSVSSAGRPEPIRHRRDTVLLEQLAQPLATVDREEDRSSSIVTTLDGELVVETSGHGSATGPGAEGEAATL